LSRCWKKNGYIVFVHYNKEIYFPIHIPKDQGPKCFRIISFYLNWYFHKASLLFCKVGKYIFYLEMVSSSCYLRNKKDAAREHQRKN